MIGKDKILDRPRTDLEIATEDVTIGKILVETTVGIEVDKTLEERSRERSPTPRRDGNRLYNSPNTSSGTRSRSNSRVTMNRDRIRCFRCREYDHFANECPNTGIDDSDGYESDSAALQLMATDVEAHDKYDIARFTEEVDHLNL